MRYAKPITEDGHTIYVDDGQPVLVELMMHTSGDVVPAVDAAFCAEVTEEMLAEAEAAHAEAAEKREEAISQMPEHLAELARGLSEAIGLDDAIPEDAEHKEPMPIGEPDAGRGINFLYRMSMN